VSVATVTATVDTVNVPARVRLDIADVGSPAFTTVTVTRHNPDGTVSPVRTTDGNPVPMSGGAGLVYDYEAPYGAAVTYSTLETPANVTTPVTVPASQVWLIHPGVPSLSLPIRLGRGSFMSRVRAASQAVFKVLGRSTPLVYTDGARKSIASTLVALVQSAGQLAAMEALLADTSVLLLNVPTTLGYNFPTCYVSIGDVTEVPTTELVAETWLTLSMPFTVVDRPAGGTQAARTLADLAVYATLADLAAAYPTLAAVAAGP
jgi:hypothetical protein